MPTQVSVVVRYSLGEVANPIEENPAAYIKAVSSTIGHDYVTVTAKDAEKDLEFVFKVTREAITRQVIEGDEPYFWATGIIEGTVWEFNVVVSSEELMIWLESEGLLASLEE